MSNTWKIRKLADVTTKIGSGATPRGGKEAYHNSGIPLIRSQNILDFSFSHTGLAFINETQADLLKNVTIESEDVLLNITGDSVARCCMVDSKIVPARVNQHVAIIRIDKTQANPYFIKYFLLSPSQKSLMLSLAGTGATRNALTKGMIENFDIPLPPLEEQEAIAEILSSLDDKIELNNQMNKTLEQTAQAIFKHWFVDFEFSDENGSPYKSSGGKMQDSELGPIPANWRVGTLGEVVETISETFPLKSVSQVIFLNTGDIKEGEFLHANWSSTDSLPGQAKKSIHKGDILFSEIRPKNRRYAYVDFDASDYVVSTKLMVLRAKNGYPNLFTYFFLQQQESIDYLQLMAESRSGTFPQITFDVLSKMRIILPSTIIHKIFIDKILTSTYEGIASNCLQNKNISALRDTLLLKLMSGELRVPGLKQQMGA
jgi:type I restriction enzyme S subunit